MNPEHQVNLGSGGEYSPSSRASKASHAGTSGSGPVVGDGPKGGSSYSSDTAKRGGDMPKQNVGGSGPANQGLTGSDKLGNTKSVNDR